MKLSEFLEEVRRKEGVAGNLKARDAHTLIINNNQTPEEWIRLVKGDVFALRFVHRQTPEICLAAVKRDGYALQYVRNQTPEICLAAVRQNIKAIMFIDKSIFEPEPDFESENKLLKEALNAIRAYCETYAPTSDILEMAINGLGRKKSN